MLFVSNSALTNTHILNKKNTQIDRLDFQYENNIFKDYFDFL